MNGTNFASDWLNDRGWKKEADLPEEDELVADGGVEVADPEETAGGMLSPAPGTEDSYNPRDDGVTYDFEPEEESYDAFTALMGEKQVAFDGGQFEDSREETMAGVSHEPPVYTGMDNPEL